jgi:type VI secretion system protein ImpH
MRALEFPGRDVHARAERGPAHASQAFFDALSRAPHRHDFYQALRRIECLFPDHPRWGCALRPADEPIRLGQQPELSFAPAPLAAFDRDDAGGRPRLQVRLFGLLGPNGPLPTHLTECARDRLRHAGDPALARFLDLFHHRFLALFYRAWAQAQPHVHRDRPGEDRFAVYVGALAGLSPDSCRPSADLPDPARLFHVAALMRPVRNADGIAGILRHFFGVPVRVRQFVGHWMPLGREERTRLGDGGAPLGAGAVLGGRVWDRQHKFRVVLGPLDLRQYAGFLPGGALRRQLVEWVRLYLSFELEWDAQLVLRQREVPRLCLGAGPRLGWTTWLGTRRSDADAADLYVRGESVV